jgi:hypothetical protein
LAEPSASEENTRHGTAMPEYEYNNKSNSDSDVITAAHIPSLTSNSPGVQRDFKPFLIHGSVK